MEMWDIFSASPACRSPKHSPSQGSGIFQWRGDIAGLSRDMDSTMTPRTIPSSSLPVRRSAVRLVFTSTPSTSDETSTKRQGPHPHGLCSYSYPLPPGKQCLRYGPLESIKLTLEYSAIRSFSGHQVGLVHGSPIKNFFPTYPSPSCGYTIHDTGIETRAQDPSCPSRKSGTATAVPNACISSQGTACTEGQPEWVMTKMISCWSLLRPSHCCTVLTHNSLHKQDDIASHGHQGE